jgi:glycosyltransferase involved in cell wall biosynthesis
MLTVLSEGSGQNSCEKLRVVFISSGPATKFSSGYYVAKAGKSPAMNLLAQVYDIKSFCWTKRSEQPIDEKLVYLLDGLQITISLLRCLLRDRFKAIVTTGIPVLESVPTFITAKLLRIPIIIRETHWYWPDTLASKFTWPINKLMAFNCNLVICPGKKAYAYWRSLGIPEKKIKIIPFYASVLQIDPQIAKLTRELHAKFRNEAVVLYFGRLIKKKGVEYLIKAFAKLEGEFRDVLLVVAGDGPERSNLEKLCAELQLGNVIFTGAVNEEVKPAYFSFADIYVYPSITLELPEEWPLGVVEAMSMGKPVIVTDAVGSAPDVVQQGINGFVVPEKDSNGLYRAMKRIILDKELRKSMGAASANIIKNEFTYDRAAEGLTDAINFVIQPKTQQTPATIQQSSEISLRTTA